MRLGAVCQTASLTRGCGNLPTSTFRLSVAHYSTLLWGKKNVEKYLAKFQAPNS
jgi:hypothetical protein